MGSDLKAFNQVSDHRKGVISSFVSLFESIPCNSRSFVFFSTNQIILLATNSFRAPLKTVLFREGGVSRVLTAFGAQKLGALRAVRPHVFAHTLRFSARGFLALTKNAWFLEVP